MSKKTKPTPGQFEEKRADILGRTISNLSRMMPQKPIQCPKCYGLIPADEYRQHLRECEIEVE